jgi:hypothetical protein
VFFKGGGHIPQIIPVMLGRLFLIIAISFVIAGLDPAIHAELTLPTTFVDPPNGPPDQVRG